MLSTYSGLNEQARRGNPRFPARPRGGGLTFAGRTVGREGNFGALERLGGGTAWRRDCRQSRIWICPGPGIGSTEYGCNRQPGLAVAWPRRLGSGSPAAEAESLPALPAEQQKIVRALLAAQNPEKPLFPMTSRIPKNERFAVLVINDSFPRPRKATLGSGADATSSRIAREGRRGDVHRARGGKQQAARTSLRQAGIHTYGNDLERLPYLGREVSAPFWSFREVVLEQGRFDLAILVHSFQPQSFGPGAVP